MNQVIMVAADDNKMRQITLTAVCAAVGGCTGTGFPVLGITASAQLTDVNSIMSIYANHTAVFNHVHQKSVSF